MASLLFASAFFNTDFSMGIYPHHHHHHMVNFCNAK